MDLFGIISIDKRRVIVFGVTLIMLGLLVGNILLHTSKPHISNLQKKSNEPILSEIAKLFEKDTLIVVGENASYVEQESTQLISEKLEELTGNEPTIKIDTSQISETDRADNNLILVGVPNSNRIITEVSELANTTKVTKEYPGENKGILKLLANPWSSDRVILIVAGSDEWGVKVAAEALDETEALDTSNAIVDGSISPDKYVFIEHRIHIHVEVVEGDYRGALIDSPTYSFKENTGTLRGIINFDVDDTLKMVYGNGLIITGVGGGKDTMLYGVYELPYQHDELFILDVNPDGTTHLSYKNVSIILKSGEDWVNITSRTEIQQYENETTITDLTITDRITHYGILHKSRIEDYSMQN